MFREDDVAEVEVKKIMKDKSEVERDMSALLQWFEEVYSPEMYKGAEIKVKGLKGTIIIKIYYEL